MRSWCKLYLALEKHPADGICDFCSGWADLSGGRLETVRVVGDISTLSRSMPWEGKLDPR